MIHPASELRHVSAEVGDGVFATEYVPRHACCGCSTSSTTSSPRHRSTDSHHRCARSWTRTPTCEPTETRCCAGICGRYMNHSCEPTSRGVGEWFEGGDPVDIRPGDELTCQSGALNLIDPLVCRCRAATCQRAHPPRRPDPIPPNIGTPRPRRPSRCRPPSAQPLLPYTKLDPGRPATSRLVAHGPPGRRPLRPQLPPGRPFDMIHPATRAGHDRPATSAAASSPHTNSTQHDHVGPRPPRPSVHRADCHVAGLASVLRAADRPLDLQGRDAATTCCAGTSRAS